MLTKFEVTNFKNFEKTFTFDFTNTKQYAFNAECVNQGIVNKALIYGPNGVGKSNLGFALFDLVGHLTSNNLHPDNYKHYLNAISQDTLAEFTYEFKFDQHTVEYRYGKSSKRALIFEKLIIDSKEYISIDRRNSPVADINFDGTQSLQKDLGDAQISVISYIRNNAVLATNDINRCFSQFIQFVNGMLFFRSLQDNSYIGYKEEYDDALAYILDKGSLEGFQSFLNEAGIKCQLSTIEDENGVKIRFVIGKKHYPFYEIASTGTKSLTLFYAWYQRLRDTSNYSFVFIDEFDAFYHHSLSTMIIEKLRDVQAQLVLTTHNTSIMSNDLLRPDCYFLMNEQQINSLANRTRKELRFAHNIEKMYKAGTFGV
ncbi:MAG: AAA15 family ATPase/GTPase [Phenylobacterium sp.]|jgi:AAA15 family ATPase/GTPase